MNTSWINLMTSAECQTVVLGSGGVGKSSLVIRFIQDVFIEKYDPTIEDSYRHQIEVDSTPVMLQILDTAGTEQFTSMREMYMRNGDGFLVIYSITAPSSFGEIPDILELIRRVRDAVRVSDIPMILIGNKADLREQREVTTEQGEKLAEKYQVKFYETSAKTKANIEESFFDLVRLILHMKPPKRKRRGPCSIL